MIDGSAKDAALSARNTFVKSLSAPYRRFMVQHDKGSMLLKSKYEARGDSERVFARWQQAAHFPRLWKCPCMSALDLEP